MQATQATAAEEERPLTEPERNAMRSYLQRAEVRLSTLHRIAIAFISGAGLLLLMPAFFKDEVSVLVRFFLDAILTELTLPGLTTVGLIGRLALFGLLIYPFILSLAIPLYALYLLLKDVIHFYFTIYIPGFPERLMTPTFALSGISFSPDESPEAKRRILEYQYRHSSAINFAIPFSPERRRAYFDAIITSTNGDILPETRRYEVIEQTGVLTEEIDQETVNRFGAAFGLARSLDRALVEEVATSEISLVRHIIYLRRMVLRYMKTLLMFIWTTLVTFIMLPFLQEPRLPTFFTMAIGYLVWAVLVMRIMRMPVGWIFRHLHGIPATDQIDKQLVIMENQVRTIVLSAIISAAAAVVVSGVIYLR